MNTLARAFPGTRATIVAASLFGVLAVHSGKLLAQQPDNKKAIPTAASWIGKKVVTKYCAPLQIENQKENRDRIFRVYTVLEHMGKRFRLEFGDLRGWIEATDVLLLDEAIDFYSQEIGTKPSSAAAFYQRGLIWKLKAEIDKAIDDYSQAIRLAPTDASLLHRSGRSICREERLRKGTRRSHRSYPNRSPIRLGLRESWPHLDR